MHFRVVVIFLLMVFFSSKSANSQEVYNACDNALEICPNNTYSISNIGATSTVCPNCEDDFATCFVSNNSIWLTFTTNAAGGNVQVDFSNLVFETGAGQDNEKYWQDPGH